MRLIDADAFIEKNKDIIDCEIDHPKYQDTLRELIDDAPTVERPHGEWILDAVVPCSIAWFRCSYCGYKYEAYKQSNFCPNCGADMREGEAE